MIEIGSKTKHDEFVKRHARFFEQLDELTDAENVVFGRTLTSSNMLDPVVFYLGIRSVQDFNAIVLLAAHGQALPANALVRGMYERVVTAAYLRNYPEEVSSFVNYDYIQRYKAANALNDSVGLNPEEQEGFAELKNEYEQLKSAFMVTDCKKCGTKRMNHTWSKTHFVDMTRKVPPLDALVVGAYYLPLLQVHSTLKSISAMLYPEGAELAFKTDYTGLCDEIFKMANLLLGHVFRIQSEHFLIPEIEQATEKVIDGYFFAFPEERQDTPNSG